MKPSIPKGTRDFSSAEIAQRNFIIDVIKSSFENFGFQPIETPSFENSSTLMGKYGDEGDRLIFKLLNSGDFLSKADEEVLRSKNSLKLTSQISEKALRYDLTVPFARYVVQRQNEITFPFKRYQIQPVWRADRPQKGRFREFLQCDADVVGSKSLIQEVECIQLYDNVFTKLGLKDTVIKINNRKILSGIAEIIGESEKLIDFTVALDKLDKIGAEGVMTEMKSKGITENAIEKLQPLFKLSGTNREKLDQLKGMLESSVQGLDGIEDLEFVIQHVEELGLGNSQLKIDVTLARGLNYYTGAIFEVSAPEGVKIGSIGGGGRYDDLTGIFGLKDVSGIGISFGLDRIYLVLQELNLLDKVQIAKPKVIFLNFQKELVIPMAKAMTRLRENNIKSEIYPDTATSNKQQKKQWKYVNSRGIENIVSDMIDDKFILKNLKSGEQKECNLEELVESLK